MFEEIERSFKVLDDRIKLDNYGRPTLYILSYKLVQVGS